MSDDLEEIVKSKIVGSGRKPHEYWKDIDNVQIELRVIIDGLGRFPKAEEIKRINSSLSLAISKYHGGINQIRVLHGEKELIKTYGYWQNIENVQGEINGLVEELGRFPTSAETQKTGLYNAIIEHYGSYQNLRKVWNEKEIKVPPNYYQKIEHIQIDLDLIIDKLGRFPNYMEIGKLNRPLQRGIRTYWSMNEIRKLYSAKIVKKDNGYYQNLSNVKKTSRPNCGRTRKISSF